MTASSRAFFFSRRGILPRTAFTIAWMAVLVGVLSILVTTVVTRERAQRLQARELDELLDTVESTVKVACFVQDRTLAAEVVRGLLKNTTVLGVTIRANGHKLALGSRASSPPAETTIPLALTGWFSQSVGDERIVRRVASPFAPEQYVGEIILVPDPEAVSQRVTDEMSFVGLLLGVQWLAIGSTLLVLALRAVVRPIKTISDRLHEMEAEKGEQLAVPSGHERTEIGRLVADINALAMRLVSALGHVTEQARQLAAAKDRVDAQAVELEAKNVKLGRTLRMQEEVERIARHDLKTPLSSIAAIPALLRRNWQPSEDEEALLEMVENSARRVLRMVSLSLDLYRMEEGTYAFNPKVVDIAALTLAVIHDLDDAARAKEVELRMDTEQEPPIFVYAEEILCYSILANLLDNAVAAAPGGSTVLVSIRASNCVDMEIHNEGTVPMPVRGTFFEKYATFGKKQGTGLGTYSARLMARVQGGELAMSTSDAEGTTLKLELMPLPDQEAPGRLAASTSAARFAVMEADQPLPPLRVLLVDDDPDNRLIMKMLLPSPPLDIETASNGYEALESCRSRYPDIVFMDLEMPVMDGFEALSKIRALQAEREEGPSRMVAFSAHDDEASRQRSVAAGFDLHLNKPCSRGELHALLAGIDCVSGESRTEVSKSPKMTVWVDEDIFEAIPGFLESRRALVADLRGSLTAGDRDALRRLAHKLKGSLEMYGFKQAAQICREIENDHLCANAESLATRIGALEQHLAHVMVRMRNHPNGRSSLS